MAFKKSLLLIVFLPSLLVSTYAMSSPHNVAPSMPPSSGPNKDLASIFKEAIKVEHLFKPYKPEVVEFCSGTENSTLCADTIAPYFQGSFDPLKALEAEIEATLNQSLKVANIIAKKLSDSNTNKKALDAFDICKSQYESIMDAIKEAMQLLNNQNVVDAYYKFSSVLSDRSACENAFLESPGVNIPFADDSFVVSQLGGNCMAIMDGIVNNHYKLLI